MNYTKKAFSGFVFASLGMFGAYFFGYLLRLFLANEFTVEEYGLIYAVFAFFGLFTIIQSMGIPEAITRYVAKYQVGKKDKKTKEVVMWGLWILSSSAAVVAIITFALSDWLSRVYFKDPAASLLVKLFALAILVMPTYNVTTYFLRGRQLLGHRAFCRGLFSIVLLAITWLLVQQGMGMTGAILAYTISYLLLTLTVSPWLFQKALPKFFSIQTKYSTKTARALFAYGLPVMLTGFAGLVLTFSDTAILTYFSTVAEVGIYQAAVPTANLLLITAVILRGVLMPMVTELWERKKKSLIGKAMRDIYVYAGVLLVPLVVSMMVYPDVILNLMFGGEYVQGATILRILAFSIIFLVLHAINSSILSGIGKPKETTKSTTVGAIINIVLNFALIPTYGGLGAAYATLASSIIMFVSGSWFVGKNIKISLPWFPWIKTLVCGVGFFGVLWYLQQTLVLHQYVKIIAAAGLAGIAYLLLVAATKTVTVQEVLKLKKRIIQ